MSKRGVAPLLLSMVVACSGGDDDQVGEDGGVSVTCMEATMHSDYDWIQEKVFTPGCAAFNSCHKGAALEAGGLSLEPGDTIPQTVNIDSDLFPQFKRIAPGDTANSYMMIILTGMGGPLDPEIGTMPLNNPRLCQQKIDAVGRWIAAGAMEENPVDAGVDSAPAPIDAAIGAN
jgi:hypothetical protein